MVEQVCVCVHEEGVSVRGGITAGDVIYPSLNDTRVVEGVGDFEGSTH